MFSSLFRIASLCLLAVLAALGCGSGNSHLSDKSATVSLVGSKQGQSVAFADIDGDGRLDKLVGAPYAARKSGIGVVLIYRNAPGGFSSVPTQLLGDEDNFGFSLAAVGDVDGDGTGDLAVGAIGGSGGNVSEPSLSGTVTVYMGGGNGKIIRKLSGVMPMDKFGYAIASGDLNGDGYSDVIVGAPFATTSSSDPNLYQAGAVHVYFGPDLSTRIQFLATSAIKGLGWAVAAGDINADGTADLLVGATGKVLGFYGSAVFTPSIAVPDVTVSSAAAGFGRAIAVIGDNNGDGYGETVISAPTSVIGGSRDTGSIYIVKGGTGARTVNADAAPAPADLIVRIDGAGLFSRFGAVLAPLGDIDTDGIPDLAVGSPMADVMPNDLSGKVYVFKGKDLVAGATLASSTVINGMIKNQGFGASLAFGSGKLLIGGPRSNGDTGGVAMVDPATGRQVSGGSSGGSSGGGGECH